MRMSDDDKKIEQRHFTAVWEFYKKYYTPEEDTDYWQAMVEEAGQLSNNLNRMGISLLMAVLEELKTKHQERK